MHNTFKVTDNCIKDGSYGRKDACPLVLAAGALKGFSEVRVSYYAVSAVMEGRGRRRVSFPNSRELKDWLNAYDTEQPVLPITVELRERRTGVREAVIVEQEAIS